MTTKLLNFYGFARVAAPWARRAKATSSANPVTTLGRAEGAAAARLRPILECHWQIDPATGALLARWEVPAADTALDASAGTENPGACPRKRLRLPQSATARSADSRAAA